MEIISIKLSNKEIYYEYTLDDEIISNRARGDRK